MKTTTIKHNNNIITFNVNSNKEIALQDINFIQNLNEPIYWSDNRLINYCFDLKLPSGNWFENIIFNNELTKADALILN